MDSVPAGQGSGMSSAEVPERAAAPSGLPLLAVLASPAAAAQAALAELTRGRTWVPL